MEMWKKRAAGFTLIEILIVVAIIGLLAAIAVANYLNALTKAKQKRTMADIRLIGQAWEARASDLRSYNAAGYTYPSAPIGYGDLATLLSPTYMRNIPRMDGWGKEMQFAMDQPMTGSQATTYSIRSAGKDGIFESAYTPGPTEDPDIDIVFSEGNFIVWPEKAAN